MPRCLLVLTLCLSATAAFAGTPPAASEESGSCPKQPKAAAPAAPDNDNAAPPRSGSTSHLRATTPHVLSPRWHSLLPGMFR